MEISRSVKQTLSQPDNVELVLTLLNQSPTPSRHGLAKELCQRLDLRDGKGDWQMASTSKALRDLDREGLWHLPEPLFSGPREWNATRLNGPVPPPTSVPASAGAVRGLRLVEVADEEHVRIWNELMLGEHPLKDCRLVGRQLRYLLASDHGWLGGLGFGSAALQLEGRDDWIGWSTAQRRQHLERVINMNRF
jgi:hypothetical protein